MDEIIYDYDHVQPFIDQTLLYSNSVFFLYSESRLIPKRRTLSYVV